VRFDAAQLSGFAARLSDARAALGLSRREVCERCPGVGDPQRLYNYERARRAPESLEVVRQLESAVGLAPGTLHRLLGLAPLSLDLAPPTTADAIAADPALSRVAKEQLLSAYRRLAD
jgi:transcriptional regulator with XRE-family HTH domain